MACAGRHHKLSAELPQKEGRAVDPARPGIARILIETVSAKREEDVLRPRVRSPSRKTALPALLIGLGEIASRLCNELADQKILKPNDVFGIPKLARRRE